MCKQQHRGTFLSHALEKRLVTVLDKSFLVFSLVVPSEICRGNRAPQLQDRQAEGQEKNNKLNFFGSKMARLGPPF